MKHVVVRGLAADDVTVNQVGVEGNQLLVADVVAIDGNAQVTLAISSAGVQTAALDAGTYAVWSTTDCFLKVGTTASDVTIGTGYPLYSAATPLTVIVPDQYKIGAITSSAIGTLSYHKVG